MKHQYNEGDIFCFPLSSGGFALGVVARKPKGARVLLGYFFGPRLSSCPNTAGIPILEPAQAIRILIFGDLGLVNGEWKVIGSIAKWDRGSWPFPKFIRTDDIINRTFFVTYTDDLPDGSYSEERTDANVDGFERDSMFGYGAVEIEIGMLLQKEERIDSPGDDRNHIGGAELSRDSRIAEDLLAIKENHRASRDPFAPTEITFWFYVSTKSSAAKLAKAARELRYSAILRSPVKGDSPQENAWSVQITLEAVLTPEAIETHSDVLEALGKPFGADFDGWDAAVVE